MRKIAVLGATSHIAKGLIYLFSLEKDVKLYLFGRTPNRIKDFLLSNKIRNTMEVSDYLSFPSNSYYAIINCIGQGNPRIRKENIGQIFQVTEEFDNLTLHNIKKHPETIYIFLSSGAVYGNLYKKPANTDNKASFNVNNFKLNDFYGIAKLNAEVKHRSLSSLKITDLRIFSYLSRFIDLDSGYLLTDMINAIIEKKEFITDYVDIKRDYLNPEDLFRMINCCFQEPKNCVYDLYSRKPVSKFKILEYFKTKYRLNYKFTDEETKSSISADTCYYSKNHSAETIGYKPMYSSLDTIKRETKFILGY